MGELAVAIPWVIVIGTEVAPQVATEARLEIVFPVVMDPERTIVLEAREIGAAEQAGIVLVVATLEVLGTEEVSMGPGSTAAVRAPAAAAELPAWVAVRAVALAEAVVVVEVAAAAVVGDDRESRKR